MFEVQVQLQIHHYIPDWTILDRWVARHDFSFSHIPETVCLEKSTVTFKVVEITCTVRCFWHPSPETVTSFIDQHRYILKLKKNLIVSFTLINVQQMLPKSISSDHIFNGRISNKDPYLPFFQTTAFPIINYTNLTWSKWIRKISYTVKLG